jgi:hypothetical protein
MIGQRVAQPAHVGVGPGVRDDQVRCTVCHRTQRVLERIRRRGDRDVNSRQIHQCHDRRDIVAFGAHPRGAGANGRVEDVALGAGVAHRDARAADSRVVQADRVIRPDHPGGRLLVCRPGNPKQACRKHGARRHGGMAVDVGGGRALGADTAQVVIGHPGADLDGTAEGDDHVGTFTNPGSESSCTLMKGCTAGETKPGRSM